MTGKLKARRAQNEEASDGAGPATLADEAYRALKQDIILGRYGPGQPLRLDLLRQHYGLSFSPLREALNRLQSERLVVSVALRGFSVAPLSPSEMRDVTETRILIEGEALRRSIRHGDDDWEAAIVASFHALSLQVKRLEAKRFGGDGADGEALLLEARHLEFHRALISQCRSSRLIAMAGHLYAEAERYRLPALTGRAQPAIPRDVAGEHRDIMQAALDRREDVAADLLAEHYRRTADFIEAIL